MPLSAPVRHVGVAVQAPAEPSTVQAEPRTRRSICHGTVRQLRVRLLTWQENVVLAPQVVWTAPRQSCVCMVPFQLRTDQRSTEALGVWSHAHPAATLSTCCACPSRWGALKVTATERRNHARRSPSRRVLTAHVCMRVHVRCVCVRASPVLVRTPALASGGGTGGLSRGPAAPSVLMAACSVARPSRVLCGEGVPRL